MSIKSRPLRVLIVDDERDTLMTLGILLRSEGADFDTTSQNHTTPWPAQVGRQKVTQSG